MGIEPTKSGFAGQHISHSVIRPKTSSPTLTHRLLGSALHCLTFWRLGCLDAPDSNRSWYKTTAPPLAPAPAACSHGFIFSACPSLQPRIERVSGAFALERIEILSRFQGLHTPGWLDDAMGLGWRLRGCLRALAEIGCRTMSDEWVDVHSCYP